LFNSTSTSPFFGEDESNILLQIKNIDKMIKSVPKYIKYQPRLREIDTGFENNELNKQIKEIIIYYIASLLAKNKNDLFRFLESLIPEKDIKYASGKSNRYFVIKTKEGLVRIPKPKDPLLEFKEIGKKLSGKSLIKLRKEIYKSMKKV